MKNREIFSSGKLRDAGRKFLSSGVKIKKRTTVTLCPERDSESDRSLIYTTDNFISVKKILRSVLAAFASAVAALTALSVLKAVLSAKRKK